MFCEKYLTKNKNMLSLIRFMVIIFIKLSFGKTNRVLSDVLGDVLNRQDYDFRVRPFAEEELPLHVNVTINVNVISHISELQMEYSLTCYIRQEWLDPRIAYENYTKSITLNFNQFDRIWTPDLFIRNLKSGFLHTVTEPNRLLRIHPDGKILYSQRLSMTLTCDMILYKYPMDNQTCHIELGSYAYTTEDLIFNWKEDPVELNTEMSLAEYEMTHITHSVCTKKYATGYFPCLKANFHLSRRLKAYLLTTYFPSLLVVILSWFSFWIDADSTPARTSLSILTILTITTQSSSVLRSTPSNAFTKASDVWMATCLVFVFSAFIEFSIVNTIMRNQKRKQLIQNSSKGTMTTTQAEFETLDNKSPATIQHKVKYRLHSNPIIYLREKYQEDPSGVVETISKIFYPFFFILFNLVYWPHYLSGYTYK